MSRLGTKYTRLFSLNPQASNAGETLSLVPATVKENRTEGGEWRSGRLLGRTGLERIQEEEMGRKNEARTVMMKTLESAYGIG
jgi:hypothetical protein